MGRPKNFFEASFFYVGKGIILLNLLIIINSSQEFYKNFSTHALTVLTISVILQLEQIKQNEWRNGL